MNGIEKVKWQMINLVNVAPFIFLCMWSSGAFFVKTGLDSSSVWSFLTLRSLGAFVLILIIYIFLKIKNESNRQESSLSKKNVMVLCLNGLFLQVLYQSFYFLSIQHDLSVGLVALVLGLQPLITPIFSGERIKINGVLFLLIAFLGLFIALFGSKDFSSFSWSGLAFATCAVLAITVGSAYQKKIEVNPLDSALVQNALASIVFVLVVYFSGWDVTWNLSFVVSLFWMITVVSTGALLLLFYMIRQGSVNKVSSLFYFVPIVTMIFDYLVFNTPMPSMTILGSLMILISVLLYRRC